MRDIDTSNAAGIDRLPGRLLKDCTNVLAKRVTNICNLSISLKKFPSAFKLAKVVYAGMILMDLQKAFDLINHKILLEKLLPIGFSKNTISWYES